MVAVASSDDTYKVDVSTLACNSVTASGTKKNLVEVIRTGRYDKLSPVAMLGKCAKAYPEWARLGKSDLTRALADKNSSLGPESCARPISTQSGSRSSFSTNFPVGKGRVLGNCRVFHGSTKPGSVRERGAAVFQRPFEVLHNRLSRMVARSAGRATSF